MSQHVEGRSARLDLRVPPHVRDIIDRAAAIQGRSRTDFLLSAALGEANRVLDEDAVIRPALEDQLLLAKALAENVVREPTPLIRQLQEEHRRMVTRR